MFMYSQLYGYSSVLILLVWPTYDLSHPLQEISYTPWFFNGILSFGFRKTELTFLLGVWTTLILYLDSISYTFGVWQNGVGYLLLDLRYFVLVVMFLKNIL